MRESALSSLQLVILRVVRNEIWTRAVCLPCLMTAHLAVLDKAEHYALQLAAAEAPVGWTEGTPVPDGFFANMAAEHLGLQDNVLDGAWLEFNTLEAIKQARKEQTRDLQAAEAKLADLKLGVARLAASEKQETRRVRP